MKMAALCFIEKDNKVLMLHRIKMENDMHQGFWVGLGGKFEAGESPEECIRREVLEESGLTIEAPVLRGILTFPCLMGTDDWYVFLFHATDYTGELIDCNEGELAWVDKAALVDLPMHEGDRRFLQSMWEEPGFFSAKLTHDGETLTEYTLHTYGGVSHGNGPNS